MMVGLSINLCVRDICRDTTLLGMVGKIISSTLILDDKGWDDLIANYKENYWAAFPEKAEAVVRELLQKGKIEQPRIINDHHFPVFDDNWWAENETQVVWNDHNQRGADFSL